MLVLSRKVGEKIVIGGQITITIVARKGKGIRVGIEAPPEVSVHREEVQRQIQHESCFPNLPIGLPATVLVD